MSITLVRKSQIRPLNIIRSDINTTTSGSALITKVIAGTGLTLSSSTGINSGTGDVTIALSIASASVLGGVKIGSGLTIAVDGTISVTSVTWGSITGTLSSQTDLQAALNAKYNNPTGTTSQYIDGTGGLRTFPTFLSSNQLSHEVKAAVAINKGQAVYVSSADGTNMIVSLASNATEGTSSKTMGLLDTTVSTNGMARVITEGLLSGLNTNGASAGDPVWLGTGGNLIYGLVNKPVAPAHLVFIGIVTRANTNNGEIFVKVQNGFEMGELHDYVQNGVQDNYVISYESSTSLYKPKSIATLLGYTAANDASVVHTTGNETIAGIKTFSSTTQSTSISTGAVVIGGGVGIAKNLYVGGNLNIAGNLTIGGTTTTVNAQNLSVSDNMIYLNNGIQTTITNVVGNGSSVVYTTEEIHNYSIGMVVTITGVSPVGYNLTNQTITAVSTNSFTIASSVTGSFVSNGIARAKSAANPDLGFAGGYNDGSYAHTGLFRDATDNTWKFFKGYTPEPDASPYIDTAHASFAYADLRAYNITGNSFVKVGGTSSQFLKADGSIDSTTYLSSYTETSTLANVTARGATTSTAVTFSGGATISNLLLNGAPTWTEGSLALGAHGIDEGGQLVLNKATSYTYAAHLDVWHDVFRVLYGTNTASTGGVLSLNLSTRQLVLHGYISTTSYVGTAAGVLAFDTSGNIITIAVPGGNVTSVNAGTGVSVNQTTGAVTVSIGQSVATNASPTFDTVLTSNNGNGTNFRVGDDAWLGDINAANTIRLKGLQDSTSGYIVFGDSNTTALGRIGTGPLTYGGNTVYHSGNLTNLSQLTNGPGYLTSYSETDTLASVTARGASTSATLNLDGRVNIGNSLGRPASLNSDSVAHARIGGSDVHLYVASLGAAGGYKIAVQAARYSDFQSFDLDLQSNGGTLLYGGNEVATRTWVTVTALAGYATQSWVTSQGYLTSVTNIAGYAGTLIREDNRTVSPSELTAGQMKFGFGSWNNDNSSPYADFIHMRSYTDASGGTDNLIMFKKSGIGMRIWQQTWGSSSPYAEFVDVWTTANFTQTNVNNWNTAYGWGNHASAGYAAASSLASYLPLAGGTMTGQILFQTASLTNGFRWDVNSDAAGITFKNTGDGDANSYFNFFTEDNGNEYFKFSHNTWNIGSFDFMDIKNGVVRTNGEIYANASQSGTRAAGTNELINGSKVWHAGDFSSTNVSNWNTAFGWGNHASAGYLTSALAATTYVSLIGSYANPTWITSLAYSKITGVPAFLLSETDTLATVTGRGSTTSTSITTKSATTNASLNAFAVMGAGEFMTTGSNAGYFFERREGSVTSNTNWAGWYYSGSTIRLYNGSADVISITASTGATIFNSNVAINNTSHYDSTQFSLDINGGLLVKNSGKTAQFVLINANPASGGNAGFVVHTVGGTSGSSYVDIQGYYGASVAGSTTLRLNPLGGAVTINGNAVVHAGNIASQSVSYATTAGALTSMNISQFTNNSNYITSGDTVAGLNTTYLNTGTTNISSGYSRVIRNENGAGGNPSYAPVLHLAASDTMWQIAGAHGGSTTLVWRSGYSGTWSTPWWTIFHSGNFTDNSTNWNSAFSWGNHASAGYATTSYVTTQINNLINGAPGALDTLNELATALGNDANFATTVTNSIATKLSLSGGTITGDLNIIGQLGFRDGSGSYSNFIRAAAYPSEGYPLGTNYWLEYSARGGHHFILNTDGGVNAPANAMDDFVIWQGAIDGNRLLEVSNIGNLWISGVFTEASSLKIKENISTITGNLEKVMDLRPVAYNKIGSSNTELGLIAEEVAEIYPEFVEYDENGEAKGVHYSRLTTVLIGAIKELSDKIKKLETK